MNILVMDDDLETNSAMCMYFESLGHRATSVALCEDAFAKLRYGIYEIVLFDTKVGKSCGLKLITTILEVSPYSKVIVITDSNQMDSAVEFMQLGATAYISKPFTPSQLHVLIDRLAHSIYMQRKLDILSDTVRSFHPEISFTSKSSIMQNAIKVAQQSALSNDTIMLCGASGTGKTILAKAIHTWSDRATKPIGIISCLNENDDFLESELFGHVKGAFHGAYQDVQGKLIGCDGGSLFLDEVAELSLTTQTKLLHFLKEGSFERLGSNEVQKSSARVILATKEELDKKVSEGKFSKELYEYIMSNRIYVPTLSERADDIIDMAESMLSFFCTQAHRRRMKFTPEANDVLCKYHWSGNIRELRNLIERIVILNKGDTIGKDDLLFISNDKSIHIGDKVSLDVIESEHIQCIINTSSSFSAASEVLDIDEEALLHKCKTKGITIKKLV